MGDPQLDKSPEIAAAANMYIKLESKPDDNYAFDSLDKLRHMKPSNIGKKIAEVNKDGQEKMNPKGGELPEHFIEAQIPKIKVI